ncbi:hypothetical protein D6C98_00100 [Aureobasidium pullulans]|nr:hypothetical protein D6C98_00100 [Aureobasidium pullulans]
MAPSPAAGKATGGAPKTPTKLGRKPQSQTSQPPKLGQQAASGARKASAPEGAKQPEVPQTSEKPEVGDVQQKAGEAAQGAQDKAGKTAEDAKSKAEGAAEEPSKVEMKDDTEAASTQAGDDEDDDEDEGPLSKDPKKAAQDVPKDAQETAEDVKDTAEDTAEDAAEGAQDTADDAQKVAGDATDEAADAAEDAKDTAEDTAEDVKDSAEETAEDAKDTVEDAAGDATDKVGDAAEDAQDTAEDATEQAKDTAEDATEDAQDTAEDATEQVKDTAEDGAEQAKGTAEDGTDKAGETAEDAQDTAEDAKDTAEDAADGEVPEIKDINDLPVDLSVLKGLEVSEDGMVSDQDGNPIGKLAEGDAEDLAGYPIGDDGEILDDDGDLVGRVELLPEQVKKQMGDLKSKGELPKGAENFVGDLPDTDDAEKPNLAIFKGLTCDPTGNIFNDDGDTIGQVTDGNPEDLMNATLNEYGEFIDEDGNVIGHADIDNESLRGKIESGELKAEDLKINEDGEVVDADDNVLGKVGLAEGAAEKLGGRLPPLDLRILDGRKVNKKGKILNEDGEEIGELTSGELSECAGKKVNDKGEVLDDEGNTIGRVKALPQEIPQEEVEQAEEAADKAEDAQDAAEDAAEGAENAEEGAEDAQEGAEDAEEGAEDAAEDAESNLPPLSVLDGLTVNKAGKIVDSNGTVVGELTEGDAKKLSKSGVKADDQGQFWDDKGHVIGRAKTVPVEEDEESPFAGLEGLIVVKDGWVEDENGNRVGQITEGDAKKLVGRAVDEDGDILDKKGSVVGHAERYEDPEQEPEPEEEAVDLSSLAGKTLNKAGFVIGDEGVPVARLVEGKAKELAGKKLDDQGQIWNDQGKVIGRVELIPEEDREAKPDGPFAGLQGLRVVADGKVADEDENIVGEIVEGNAKRLIGLAVDEDGDVMDRYGNVKGHAEPLEEEEEEGPVDNSLLDGKKLNKSGFVVDDKGIPVGKLIDGNVKELAGRLCDENGDIHNDTGKVVGHCEVLPENERVAKAEGPFAGREGLRVNKEGFVVDAEDNVVGKVTEGDVKKLVGLSVDEDGDINDKYGNAKGHAEPYEEEDAAPVDNSILDGKKLNKQGFVVNEDGIPLGKLVEGNVKELAGRRCDEQGQIHGDTGKVVGRCEVLPENERVARPEGPFAGLEGLHVNKEGYVENAEGDRVGIITEGNVKRLVGLAVDEDGDISDKYGNTKGHAEPWEEEEQTAEDLSALAGCTVNKAGNVVDSSGTIIGRVSEGDPSTMVGKKVDGQGQIWDNAGNVIGKAELAKGADTKSEGPFAGFDGITVNKEGYVVTPDGGIVGRITEGDVKKLVAHKVDEDGEIQDKNGNLIGKAERWEPEEKERKVNPMSGRRVNKEGEVRDENGDVMGRLTTGDLGHCVGLEVDDNGYVVDNDGNKVGEVTLIENIIEDEEIPEEELTEEEKEERRKKEQDREIAEKMGAICTQTLERVQPICKQITDHIEAADRTPREELDEEDLVNKVQPLIEEAGRILQECNGSLRGLDPDGRIAAQAKGRAGTKEATPEEYRLADTLKELTTTVTTTIDNAKKRINDMPHAKKKLNPLWGLMTQPLFQILAAVGLLLTGVLGLVGQLLNGLGLGGLVNGLLGGLGIDKLLGGLGLGSVASSLGLGGKDKKKKSGGGASSLPIVGGMFGKK